MKRTLIATESQEQQTVVAWWDSFSRSRGIQPCLLMAIPNGAHLAGDARTRAIKMNIMKREGLRVGAPDLLLAMPTVWHHALFIELKRATGKPSPAQAEFGKILTARGYFSTVCFGADDAMLTIKKYLGK